MATETFKLLQFYYALGNPGFEKVFRAKVTNFTLSDGTPIPDFLPTGRNIRFVYYERVDALTVAIEVVQGFDPPQGNTLVKLKVIFLQSIMADGFVTWLQTDVPDIGFILTNFSLETLTLPVLP